ncbi:hypothetical protein [Rubripirellula reticaptiva]|uniref:Uncharacterized protein n=1 Tax=Rubripirellula reticaptiva TaxID=2528013 RepID=A0A5C6FD44_9BACT|nr:hypothetical protein [Rubripirellula reticaptiva]TWU57579.1 hypothetical protein Poly59_04860 [Rubripirellula reticaptiva]
MGLWNQTSRQGWIAKSFTAAATGWVACLAIAVSPMAVSPVLGQEKLQLDNAPAATDNATEPVLVLTLGSINKLMRDVNYLSSLGGQPQVGGMFTMIAGTYTQGIDMDMPVGVLVPLVDGVPQPIAVLPSADVKTVLKRLEAQTGPADELDDGTLVIALGPNTVYIRQLGAWAVMAQRKDLLDLAPADPTALFAGLGNDFDLAFRLQMQQVPAATRGMLVAQIRQGFEQAMEKQDGADAESAREMADSTMKQLEQFINETDTLMFGINVDEPGKQVVIDTSFTAVAGSTLAAIYGGQQPIPSQFASVIRSDAAAYYHAATSISPEAVEQTRMTLKSTLKSLGGALENEDNLSATQRDDIRAMIDRVVELAMSSIEEGRADVGTLLMADQNDFRFVFGSFVADGNEAAQIVKDLAAKIENEKGAPRFTFDVSTYKDVNMHLVEADVPASEDEARRVFGETLRVHVGTGPKAVYLAVGNNSEALLKELIDSSTLDQGADRPVGQLKFTLLPILQYANSVESNAAISAMIDALGSAADQGIATIVQNSVENGQASVIKIGEGLIKAIAAAAMQSQGRQNQF